MPLHRSRPTSTPCTHAAISPFSTRSYKSATGTVNPMDERKDGVYNEEVLLAFAWAKKLNPGITYLMHVTMGSCVSNPGCEG